MQTVIWSELTEQEQQQLLTRAPATCDPTLAITVSAILAKVQHHGDKALAELSQQFDGGLPEQWCLFASDIEVYAQQAPKALQHAIDHALDNIERFHQAQQQAHLTLEVQPGVRCEMHSEAIEKVGLYVPGGSAPLISTVLMLAKPAQLAGCRQQVLVTPPPLDPAIAYAASRCGVERLVTIGGAQAIAALAYGTETVPKVDKIFGPGSRFVTEAKQQVQQQGIAIDMPAGPSEVLLIADQWANPHFIAADLLSQAEHGSDSQVILVTDSATLAAQVAQAVAEQCAQLSRAEIANQALMHSSIIVADSIAQAIAISNAYGPEHLIIQTEKPRQVLSQIRAAGSVFLGRWSPESVGDYASGTNHVLPTYGASRTVSSLSLADFQRRFTVQELTKSGLQSLSQTVINLANAEGLGAHANAVRIRLESADDAL